MSRKQFASIRQEPKIHIIARSESLERLAVLLSHHRVAHHAIAEQIDEDHGRVQRKASVMATQRRLGRRASRETEKLNAFSFPSSKIRKSDA